MKNLITLIALLFSINTVMAQKEYLSVDKTYPTAKIYQKGKSAILKVSNLKIVNDTLIQFQEGNKQEQFSVANVRYVSVKSGTYAGNYALYGGLVGLLSGVVSVLQTDQMGESGVNWMPFYVGFTAGGAAIGGLIGVTQAKWKTLYLPSQHTSYNLYISPNVNKYYCGLGIKVTF